MSSTAASWKVVSTPTGSTSRWNRKWCVPSAGARAHRYCIRRTDGCLRLDSRRQFPYMNAFPNPHSVLILDNCPIHHQRCVMESAHARGILVRFLEPYDPDSMPVETAYKIMKNWLRGSTGRCSTTWGCLWSRSCAWRIALGERGRVGAASLFPPGRVRLILAWNTTNTTE